MTDKNNQDMEEVIPAEVAKEAVSKPAPVEKKLPQAEEKDGSLPKVKASSLAKPGKVSKSKSSKVDKSSSFSSKEKMKSWYYSRYQSVVVQRNILLLFSLLSMVAVTVSVVFVKSVTSSKSLDPYVIEIEEKTGVPVVVEQLSTEHLTGNQMVIRYFLNKYIHAASGYDPRLYKIHATQIRLFSTPSTYSSFRRRINPKELGGDSTIKVRIKSIQFPGPNTAQIRLLRVIKRENSVNTVNELINMDFRFSDLSLSSEERLINPLGFQVGRYLITEEIYEY